MYGMDYCLPPKCKGSMGNIKIWKFNRLHTYYLIIIVVTKIRTNISRILKHSTITYETHRIVYNLFRNKTYNFETAKIIFKKFCKKNVFY